MRRRAFHLQAPVTARAALAVAGQHRDDHLAEGQQGRLRQDAHQVNPGVALEHGAQLVPPLEPLHGDGVPASADPRHRERRQPAGHRFPVPHPRLGRDDHPRAGDLAPPRQVEVLAHGDDPGVEPLQLGEEVSPHERAPARGHEDVAHGVVLAMVDLALDDPVDDCAGLVAAHPDVQQDGRVVPVDELRGHHAGVRAERLLHQLVHDVRLERHVVMAQQEERRPLHHAQRFVGGGRIAGPAGQVAHEGVGQDAPDPLRHLGALVAGREDQDGKLLVVLRRQGGEGLLEPGPGIGGDQDGDHGRHLGVHQGAEAIRSGIGPSGTDRGPWGPKSGPECLLLFNKHDTLVHERRRPAGGPSACESRSTDIDRRLSCLT